eukprot:m.270786 g.270786  ORF g.270786 m.270786 type:complete len:181 (+) comp40544_c2_seq17:1345-1887(+)
MAPGLFGMVGGRPRPSPVFKLFSFMYPKGDVQQTVQVDNSDTHAIEDFHHDSTSVSASPVKHDPAVEDSFSSSLTGDFLVGDLAFLRSGDKGDTANIGVVARKPEYYPVLRKLLTEEAVRKYFSHLLTESSCVTRYELPGIRGFNFMLTHSLGGGGIASLRPDPQGKAYGQMLADYQLKI